MSVSVQFNAPSDFPFPLPTVFDSRMCLSKIDFFYPEFTGIFQTQNRYRFLKRVPSSKPVVYDLDSVIPVSRCRTILQTHNAQCSKSATHSVFCGVHHRISLTTTKKVQIIKTSTGLVLYRFNQPDQDSL
jgi:hypothetical protein